MSEEDEDMDSDVRSGKVKPYRIHIYKRGDEFSGMCMAHCSSFYGSSVGGKTIEEFKERVKGYVAEIKRMQDQYDEGFNSFSRYPDFTKNNVLIENDTDLTLSFETLVEGVSGLSAWC